MVWKLIVRTEFKMFGNLDDKKQPWHISHDILLQKCICANVVAHLSFSY